MSNFLNEMKKQASLTETENGAIAYDTTQNTLLDLFAEIGALRNANERKIVDLFEKSYAENPLLTLKCVFYSRDIRGGQGERRVFRVLIKHLANTRPDVLRLNLSLIPEYGRFDDLWVLLETQVETDVINFVKEQLDKDLLEKHPSLLAKWMPSCDTSSSRTRQYAAIIRKALNMSRQEYRKQLSSLREKIKVTERLISQNRWEELDLEKLTANNYIKYQDAFTRNIPESWNAYINRVKEGSASVKSATLYPYNIVNKVKYSIGENADLCDELWKALPDYTNEKPESALCMVDVSSSMNISVSGGVTAMDVAISLGLYVSERVEGPFKNHFLTFSSSPKIVKVKGETLKERVINMERANWGMSTNLQKAFDLILNTAISTNATQEEMPKKLIIVSDMQFDYAIDVFNKKTLFANIEDKFKSNGYEMPTVVFWNVNSSKTAFQVSEDCKNVLLCSGCSPAILKGVLKYTNPMELVLETLNAERYNLIRTH